jgi:hypothetical protein
LDGGLSLPALSCAVTRYQYVSPEVVAPSMYVVSDVVARAVNVPLAPVLLRQMR